MDLEFNYIDQERYKLFSVIARKVSDNFFNSVSYKEEFQHRILAENFKSEEIDKDLFIKYFR